MEPIKHPKEDDPLWSWMLKNMFPNHTTTYLNFHVIMWMLYQQSKPAQPNDKKALPPKSILQEYWTCLWNCTFSFIIPPLALFNLN